jgi:hypothetical protein
MRCDHEQDDGAYVLGALSPAERAAYERHLNTCSFCREAVADLAVIPGLLGRLDPADFARLLEPDPPKVSTRNRMPDLVTAAQTTRRRERRRTRRRTLGTALVAAVLTVIVGGGALSMFPGAVRLPGAGNPPAGAGAGATVNSLASAPMVAMQPVSGSTPISAQLSLTANGWGTEIIMKCAYEKSGTSTKANTFRLIAYGPDGAREEAGSWKAAPGADLKIPLATRFAGSELSRLVLVRWDDTPILAYDVP